MQFKQLLNRRLQRLSRLSSQLLRRLSSPLAFRLDGIRNIFVVVALLFIIIVAIIVEFEILKIELKCVS